MKSQVTDVIVGIFLIVGFAALGWLALQLGEVPWLVDSRSYTLYGEFNNISGVKAGADIQISGVKVGTVKELTLNDEFFAVVTMQLHRGVKVPVDSIASVKSQGIIGDKFIQISLGGDELMFKDGETITDTESALDLESLISKFAFGKVD
ncbi:MAG TPA: outer membrane lipid asymmetry maintenance protein MlaD [Desulfobulbaceae bacterium]|nr:outer membrane lipid asymmetry maintenance protein MlaD [Desulfobulbaceae bacterium]